MTSDKARARRREFYAGGRKLGLTRRDAGHIYSERGFARRLMEPPTTNAVEYTYPAPYIAHLSYRYKVRARVTRDGESRFVHLTVVNGSPISYDEIFERANKILRKKQGLTSELMEGEEVAQIAVTLAEHNINAPSS